MRLSQKAKSLTLDWDNISIDEAYKRVDYILENHCNVRKLMLSLSPHKGFHVRVSLFGFATILPLRNEWKDDGRRVVNDILNRPDHVHDILWLRKTDSRGTWEEKHLKTWNR